MSSVIVMGGGPVGLASAMLFARDGHEVVVLEKDPHAPPATAHEAFEAWQRPGVAQFRQVQHVQAKVRHLLEAELPNVTEELEASGARSFNIVDVVRHSFADSSSRAGDERFETITARRPVLEGSFARAAENTQNVKVLRGVAVEGLLSGTRTREGIPHVAGVRTTDGEELFADLIVDALGRRSRLPEWLQALGARAPLEEVSETGFAYYSRHYRSNDGALPTMHGSIATILDSLIVLTLPTDNGSWSMAVVAMSGDRPFKELRTNDGWERVVRAIPSLAHWTDGEPLCDVIAMAGAMDRYRRAVIDGVPVATGAVSVGDAWACTNPTAARGLSLGIAQAVALRDVARAHLEDPYELSIAFDEATERRFTPWFRQQMERDRDRVAAVHAVIEGRGAPQPDPADPLAPMKRAFMIAAEHDPDVARAALEVFSVLALPQEIMVRPGMIEKVLAASSGREPTPPQPTRAELLTALGTS